MGALLAGLLLSLAVLLDRFFVWVPWVALAVGVAVGAACASLRKRVTPPASVELASAADRWAKVGAFGVFTLQVLQVATLWLSRTDRAIASPWEVLPVSIFPLFWLSLSLLLLLADRLSASLRRALWVVQSGIAFGTSLVVYRLGFGFDPFIHQAAVRALVEHGRIELTSILYVGQYAVEAGLTRVTGVPSAWIDRLLVPLLSVGLVGVLIPRLRRAWDGGRSSVSTWAMFLLPFQPFTFSVPYHLTYLGLLFVVFALPSLVLGSGWPLAGLLLAWMALVHPLLAIPAGVLVLFGWMARRFPRVAGIGAFVCVLGLLIAAFSVYVSRLGGAMVWPSVALWGMAWQALTGFPYRLDAAPWFVEAFYRFFHLWSFLFAAIGCVGLRFVPERLRPLRLVYVGTAFGVLFAAFFLAASTQIKGIISTEQFEFALRLRGAFPIFFFPGVVALLERAEARLSASLRLAACFVVALFCTAVWFVSYPQANRYLRVSSAGVSATDVRVVQQIERFAAGRPYAALTPQMVSAAALTQFGFSRELQTPYGRRYAYAIPTGGELYQQYQRLWYEPDVTKVFETVRALSGVPVIAIAVPTSWDPYGTLGRRLLPHARWHMRIDEAVDAYIIEK